MEYRSMSSDVLVTTLIGNKIKGLRRDAGYTAVEFAQLIGCKSAQQLYRYERGINKIDIDTLVSALKILRVDIKEFFNEVMWEIQ
ncbi:XRE family transcriptional regulator [Providencia alcalifaciens]|uniref:DNA-binding helix-turn-helix protein n=2 Tax=Providencia alcalifaciens TaxID=126385 RepID=B6XEH6_9GAMM|nr:XRE family transcriptional regulator [Providencia alcalifaciens]EEB46298.1 DNA-binding helix-turn-helix protein [Providencia alcalifaciens DSM 30120]